jgi:transcriptional regulator with XRE-family HTH domain
MTDKDFSIIANLGALRDRSAMTQVELAQALGVHQGHLSKILSGKVLLSAKIRMKVEALLQNDASVGGARPDLEAELLQAMRTSESFRELMQAAIKMHNSRKG